MKILMVFPGMAGDLPPMATAAVLLGKAGAAIELAVAGCEPATREVLLHAGVTCCSLGLHRYPRTIFGKALLRVRFRALLRSTIRRTRPEVVWYHTAHALAYRGWIGGLAPGAAEVVHAHEMYDSGSRLSDVQAQSIREASCWIAPQAERADMLKRESGSRAPFWVVPNRPLETLAPPPDRDDAARLLFRKLGGSLPCARFVVYQGWISEDRCLLEGIEGFRQLARPDVGFIIMGECRRPSFERRLRCAIAGDVKIVWAGRIAPPDHLRVTAGCDVGLMLYAPTGLNNRLCAPNKLYEYAWCRLGVVMPAFPHLEAISEAHGFGRTCDPTDPAAIARATAAELDRDASERTKAAAAFLSSTPSPAPAYAEIHRFLLEGPSADGSSGEDHGARIRG
jgi:hypothetical protein